MRIEDTDRDAHAAFTAVTKGIHPTNTAETTLIAMERLFGHGHPKVAASTVVFSKDNFAVDTLVSERKREWAR